MPYTPTGNANQIDWYGNGGRMQATSVADSLGLSWLIVKDPFLTGADQTASGSARFQDKVVDVRAFFDPQPINGIQSVTGSDRATESTPTFVSFNNRYGIGIDIELQHELSMDYQVQPFTIIATHLDTGTITQLKRDITRGSYGLDLPLMGAWELEYKAAQLIEGELVPLNEGFIALAGIQDQKFSGSIGVTGEIFGFETREFETSFFDLWGCEQASGEIMACYVDIAMPDPLPPPPDGEILGVGPVGVLRNTADAETFRVFVLPEPSSLALLSLGGLMVGRRRR